MALLITASTAAANRCEKPPRYVTVDYLNSFDVVAYGRVVDFLIDGQAPRNSFVVLDLEGAWRGAPPDPMQVYYAPNEFAYPFQQGASYLIFGKRTKHGRVAVDRCGPTCREAECLTYLKMLGPPVVRLDDEQP